MGDLNEILYYIKKKKNVIKQGVEILYTFFY